MADDIRWDTAQLKAFAASLRHDKDGRELKKRMEAQFDSITKDLRDRLRHDFKQLPHLGPYPAEVGEAMRLTTKLIGGRNARVQVVGEAKTPKGRWRELGKLLNDGYLYHPAWGHWRSSPPPAYLRESVPEGPPLVDRVLAEASPAMQDDIKSVLTDYLDQLTDIRKGMT